MLSVSTRRARSSTKRVNARYEVGDIRATGLPDAAFDGAFCDKVLIHAGPPAVAVAELRRVVRPGGRIGACEWMPFFVLSSRLPEAVDAFNAIFRAQRARRFQRELCRAGGGRTNPGP
jgi:ubiquinone/menaquinone biosynthesis C-methylase UbiE